MKPNSLTEKINKENNKEEVLHRLTGKHGDINIIKSNREITEVDNDIHSLIARILVQREKRMASGT